MKSRSCPLVLKISFVQKIYTTKYFLHHVQSIFYMYLYKLILPCFLVCFLSTLHCKCWFIYSLLRMASFSCDSRWRQINSWNVYFRAFFKISQMWKNWWAQKIIRKEISGNKFLKREFIAKYKVYWSSFHVEHFKLSQKCRLTLSNI